MRKRSAGNASAKIDVSLHVAMCNCSPHYRPKLAF